MIHTSYTVGITTGEYKALQYVMVDQKEWVTNAIQARAKVASDGIIKILKGLYKEAQYNNVPFNYVENYISQSFQSGDFKKIYFLKTEFQWWYKPYISFMLSNAFVLPLSSFLGSSALAN